MSPKILEFTKSLYICSRPFLIFSCKKFCLRPIRFQNDSNRSIWKIQCKMIEGWLFFLSASVLQLAIAALLVIVPSRESVSQSDRSKKDLMSCSQQASLYSLAFHNILQHSLAFIGIPKFTEILKFQNAHCDNHLVSISFCT